MCDIRDDRGAGNNQTRIRETPLIQSMFLSRNVAKGQCLSEIRKHAINESFKFREVPIIKINHLTEEQRPRGIVTASLVTVQRCRINR